MKILYFHGRKSSPKTRKAEHIRKRTTHDVFVPAYPSQEGEPAQTLPHCYEIAKNALLEYQPDIVIGSSYGGGVLLKLVHEGLWTGPSLFLAGAGVRYGITQKIPPQLPVLLIHGTQDKIIPVEDSRILAASSDKALLIEINDDHSLASISNGLLILAVRHLEQLS